MNRTQSKDCTIGTYEIIRILMSLFDDNLYVFKTVYMTEQLF